MLIHLMVQEVTFGFCCEAHEASPQRANLLGFVVVESALQVWKRSKGEPMGSTKMQSSSRSWSKTNCYPSCLFCTGMPSIKEPLIPAVCRTSAVKKPFVDWKEGESSSLTTVTWTWFHTVIVSSPLLLLACGHVTLMKVSQGPSKPTALLICAVKAFSRV